MSVFETISEFKVDRLPSEWVTSVYNSDFKEAICLPEEYVLEVGGEVDYAELMLRLIEDLKEVGDGLNETANSSRSNDSSFSWSKVKDGNIDVKALLSFISTFIKNEIKDLNNDESRFLTLIACKLYINMIRLPGALYFLVFNHALFDKVLKVFNEVSSSVTSSSGKKPKSKDKSKNAKTADSAESDQAEETVKVTELIFSEEDKTQVLAETSSILEDLSLCLNTLFLIGDYESLKSLIEMLVNLTRMEVENNVLVNARPRPNSPGYIAYKAYLILEQLCNSKQGEIKLTVFTIMNSFLGTLIIDDKNPKLSMNVHSIIKGHTLAFVKKIISAFGEDAIPGVLSAAQKMFHLLPDKAELRVKALNDLTDLLQLLPAKSYLNYIMWFFCYAFDESLKLRLNAMDLISKVVYTSDKYDMRCLATNNGKPDLVLRLLIGVVLAKSTDTSHMARSKSFNILTHLISSNQKEIQNIISELFVDTDENVEKRFFNFFEYLQTEEEELSPPEDPLPSGAFMLKVLEIFSRDEKVHVRKNALHALSNLCILNDKWITTERLKIICTSCKDHSVMIRKQSSMCLTDIVLKYPDNLSAVEAWVEGVFPILSDSDVKSQEKIIEYAASIILDNLAPYSKSHYPAARLPWSTLKRISAGGKRMLFRIACRSWVKQHPIRFRPDMFKMLETHIGTENNNAVWFFIVSLSEYIDFPKPDGIYQYYIQSVHGLTTFHEILSQLVMESLFLNWNNLSPSVQEELYWKLKGALMDHQVPVPLIQRSLDICIKLRTDETKSWCRDLVQLCVTYLKNTISPHCPSQVDENDLKKHIFTLGEAIQCTPGVTKDVLNLLAYLIYPEYDLDDDNGNAEKWQGKVSNSVKAIAVVTLGKACLQSGMITKEYAPVFVCVLKETNATDVRNNAMTALSDLCIRFTSFIEDHLGDMCVTLRDTNSSVRMNSLKILTKLIKEDFIKLKGPIFYYLLMMLLDTCEEIEKYTKTFWLNFVVSKEPGIMCQHFVPAIFFFNDFQDAEYAEKHTMSKTEKMVFSLAGLKNFNSRAKVYKFMLSTMKDDHRFKVTHRICCDIFEEALDGGCLKLDLKGKSVLKDAMYAFASEEMRLENIRKDGDKEEEEAEPDRQQVANNVVMGIARKVLLSQLVKKMYIDSVMPAISKLKKKLQEIKSPLAKDLMICLRELMKDYKAEINEILASDPELAAEVAFDLRNVSVEDKICCNGYDYDLDLNLSEVRMQCEEMSMCVITQKELQDTIASNLPNPGAGPGPEESQPIDSSQLLQSTVQPETTASPENQPTPNREIPSTTVENSLSPSFSSMSATADLDRTPVKSV